MANTFELISAVTVGAGGASSISFTSIPATFTDISILLSPRGTDANVQNLYIGFNGVTTNLSYRYIEGNGASAGSGAGSTGYSGAVNGTNQTASTFGNGDFYIPNYAGSTFKSISSNMVTENNATTAYADMGAELWSSTAAITQVTFTLATGSFAQYSTAYLYGVKNA